jgi:hypothetical protein
VLALEGMREAGGERGVTRLGAGAREGQDVILMWLGHGYARGRGAKRVRQDKAIPNTTKPVEIPSKALEREARVPNFLTAAAVALPMTATVPAPYKCTHETTVHPP